MAAAITHNVTKTYKDEGPVAITVPETITFDTSHNGAFVIPGSTTNHEYNWSCTVANLKAFGISSDQAITIYTNAASGSSPQDTLTIVAGDGLMWYFGESYSSNGTGTVPFAGDVTKLYVTNSGSTAANVFIKSAQNQLT